MIDPSLRFLVEAPAPDRVTPRPRPTCEDLERYAITAYDPAEHDPGDECPTVRRE